HDVTTGSPALAHPGADHGEHHRVHALHVDRAAAPQDAVTDFAGEGVNLPVGRLGGNDVEVPVDEDGVAVGFGAVDARDDVRPAGRRFDHGGLDADVVEAFGDVLGGRTFSARAVAGVGGVDTDEVRRQCGDVRGAVSHSGLRCHSRSAWSRS